MLEVDQKEPRAGSREGKKEVTHNQYLEARAIMAKDVKDAWKLALTLDGHPSDTSFYAGPADAPEWIEYNALMTNFLGFCREHKNQ